MWNSRGGWKKNKKLIVGREGGRGGRWWKKLKILIVGGWGVLALKLFFFLPFLTMKSAAFRIFVYTVKVKEKQK